MRKNILIIIVLFLLFPINIYAEEYDKLELIPASEISTVDMEDYIYQNFTYINDVERQTYGVLKFDFVKNKRRDKQPLAIDFLLFDENKQNIGFVAYCTTKDLAGEYAQVQVNGGGGSPLTVFIDSSYFVKGHTKDDIAYLAVLDSNSKCYVGNSNKYAGLTIEEIKAGKVSPDWNENEFINVFSFILNVGIYTFIGILLLIVVLYVLFVALITSLNKTMFGKKPSYKFVPGINFITSIYLAFGKFAGYAGAIILVGGLFFAITQVKFNWLIILLVFTLISALVNTYKFFKKDYDFMFFDPFIKNDGTDPQFFWLEIKVKGEKKAQQIINLNYSASDLEKLPVNNQAPEKMEFVPVAVPQVDSKEEILKKIEAEATGEADSIGLQKDDIVSNVMQDVATTFDDSAPIVAQSNSLESLGTDKPEEKLGEDIPQETSEADTSSQQIQSMKDEKKDFMDMFQ